MKNFSNINFKKIIPGLISIVIVVGMFAQTFATNIDLNAFVTNDEFETKALRDFINLLALMLKHMVE